VPTPPVVESVYSACYSGSEELLVELERVYLLGQLQQGTFADTVEHAARCHNTAILETLFTVDVSKVRHLTEKDTHVDAIRPRVISCAIQGDRTDVDVLRLFLDLGLDVNKVFGDQGDALVWAVRIGRWELIQRILDLKGTFEIDNVKVC
jgi:hypothetical protein